MSVKISTTNTKLGLIPSVNLPPILSCRRNCPCADDCYGRRGNFRFKNVKESHLTNFQEYLANSETYFASIKSAINNGITSYHYFRWHATGDIIDDAYFAGMVKLARQLPDTKFLCFTKKFEIVNDYSQSVGGLPSNLQVVFSAWGDNFKIENPFKHPVAYVRFKDECQNNSIPEDAVECSGNCTKCLQCWNLRFGESVVFNKH